LWQKLPFGVDKCPDLCKKKAFGVDKCPELWQKPPQQSLHDGTGTV